MAHDLTESRRFYTDYILGQAEVDDQRLREAFNTVPREAFCGTGPWKIHTESGYVETPSDDPRYLYQDVLVGIDPSRGVNNGQPSLHARSLAAAAPNPGDDVLHIGAGTGYYSAILSELVGPSGHVEAREIDPHTASLADQYLRDRANITVVNRSGTERGLRRANVIYVNAGTPRIITNWTGALADGGRLIFPLTSGFQMGAMLLITKNGTGHAARFTSRAAFIPCLGTNDPRAGDALCDAFRRGNWREVKSLFFATPPDSTCWLEGEGWWLSTRSLSVDG
jgi:protein-L-isoaspartate(D-aspartate) O-methyltransferase